MSRLLDRLWDAAVRRVLAVDVVEAAPVPSSSPVDAAVGGVAA